MVTVAATVVFYIVDVEMFPRVLHVHALQMSFLLNVSGDYGVNEGINMPFIRHRSRK